MLPSARRRRDETAAREAAGENLWRKDFDQQALVRIAAAWELCEDQLRNARPPLREVTAGVLRVQGGWAVGQYVDPDWITYKISDELRLDGIAACRQAIATLTSSQRIIGTFDDQVNAIFREHRIAYKFVEGELISFKSDELLQEVVEPALRLMVGQQFQAAHDAYMKALKEISNGDAGDAITDAGTALQESLTALGCDGHSLGPLIKNAKKNGHLGNHDQTLIDGIEKMMHWASADRSESGDGHKYSDAEIADAWLTVHIVGALIVRLADSTPRGSLA